MNTILRLLADGGFVSGEAISAELGITRAAVWKRVRALQEQGWRIESVPGRGYRLDAGDRLEPVLWEGLLTTAVLGRGTNLYEETLDSTNLRLKRAAVEGAPSGSVCLCECQTAGRGRLGRAWNSPAGRGLWVSVLLRPELPPAQAPLITLCTAMAMERAVRELTGLPTAIKWPNDLVCGGKKLCGILLECSADPDRVEYVVIGTGLNVHAGAYPPELGDRAAAIDELTDAPLRRVLLTRYLAALEEYTDTLRREGFGALAEGYRARSCTLGSRVHVTGAVELTGTAEAIDETGALLVRTDDGVLHRVLSGDVSVRGVMGYV